MKLVCIALLALLALASAGFYTDEEYQYLFTKWATEHNKQYHHDAFFNRFQIFKANLDKIALHNMGNHSYSMDMNEFGDLTFEEFHAQYTGYRPTVNPFIRSLNAPHDLSVEDAPKEIDWRAKGAVTGVKNQQQCGSCWAFSATGSIEGIHAISKKKLVSVSEQQLVDCSGPEGNQGCNGGLMDYAFEYVIKEGGLCTEESYPYTATDGQCKTCKKEVTIKGYKDVPAGDENALLAAVAKQPVSIAIEADRSAFQFYSGGILDDSSCGTQLDHGVLAVGFGTENGKDYWIIKNSWGASWGEKGYIRFIRGKNQCGLTQAASYPTV